MGRWDSLGTSKIQTPTKVEAPHVMKKYVPKQNLSTILISRDTAVCLQFGAKIFYIHSNRMVFVVEK